MLMEIGVDSHCHVVTDTHHCTKGIGTETEMSILTHILETLTLLLHWIITAAESVNLYAFALDLYALTGTLALYQGTYYADAGTSGNLAELILIDL